MVTLEQIFDIMIDLLKVSQNCVAYCNVFCNLIGDCMCNTESRVDQCLHLCFSLIYLFTRPTQIRFLNAH